MAFAFGDEKSANPNPRIVSEKIIKTIPVLVPKRESAKRLAEINAIPREAMTLGQFCQRVCRLMGKK